MDYICGYCGKPWHSIGERMACEQACHDKRVQEEEKLKASKREEEMKKDYLEISNLMKQRDTIDSNISDLVNKYSEKYYGDEIDRLNKLFPISSLRHWFDF